MQKRNRNCKNKFGTAKTKLQLQKQNRNSENVFATTNASERFNTIQLHNGIYFYHILVNDKSIKNDKIVIIK